MNDGTDSGVPAPPCVSVLMTSYNQVRFVSEAIESALMQETTFPFEIIVCDDASTDGTRDAIENLARQHPRRVRPVLRKENVGRRPNFMDLLRRATGRYIAFLEGDDRWTATDKLQTQVDLLDRRSDCSGCFHNIRTVFDDESGREPKTRDSLGVEQLVIEDLLTQNDIATCSAMLRRSVVESLPDWFSDVPMGDWPLMLLAASTGPLCYVDRVMADYRVHPGGVWSTQPPSFHLMAEIECLRTIDAHFQGRFERLIWIQKGRRFRDLTWHADNRGEPREARRFLHLTVQARRKASAALIEEGWELKLAAAVLMPRVYRLVRVLAHSVRSVRRTR